MKTKQTKSYRIKTRTNWAEDKTKNNYSLYKGYDKN